MKKSKTEMIEAIYRRYLALNEKDYGEGRINAEVKEMCDNAAVSFKELLNGLTETEVTSFFHLDRGVQMSVFSWDSGCANAMGMPKQVLDQMAAGLDKAIEESGYGEIPIVKKVMGISRKTLDWLLSGQWKELKEGVMVVDFDNNIL